ncbi:MAG: DUF1801 domain-containing protein [Deltaproteobacteria bacterium]|nr:MAG: DUF1801 domain-containing protein [Deltaproteobacteria bacterium]
MSDAEVRAYIDRLPADRRPLVEALRTAIRKGLPPGYAEGMQYGMIGYFVPHDRYPAGYHCNPSEPLPFAAIGNQKGHVGLYLFCVYTDPGARAAFVKAWRDAGRRLDMGASCVRVRHIDDVPFDVVTETVRGIPVDRFVATYEASLSPKIRARQARRAGRATAGRDGTAAKKKTATKKKTAAKKKSAAT